MTAQRGALTLTCPLRLRPGHWVAGGV